MNESFLDFAESRVAFALSLLKTQVKESSREKQEELKNHNGAFACFQRLIHDKAESRKLVQMMKCGDPPIYAEAERQLQQLWDDFQRESPQIQNSIREEGSDTQPLAIKLKGLRFAGQWTQSHVPEGRFHMQTPQDTSIIAWLDHNPDLSPDIDYAWFIAGLLGQFVLAADLLNHFGFPISS